MLTRRDFLKLAALSGLSLGTVAFDEKFPDKGKRKPIGLGRVTASKIHVYRDPSLNSERIGARYRDELIHLLEEIISPDGPQHNPLWLRIHGGYAHSGYLQAVQTRLNPPPTWIPRSGRVFELTVPLSQSYRYTRSSGWSKLYRLYYQSLHWVTAIVEGPDGDPWAQIMDERLRIHYYVPATHLQPIPIADFQPISPDVPPEDKRILVSLSDQSLTAFEGDQAVFRTRISSGIPSKGPSPNGIPTTTPSGRFIISRKMPVRHMGSVGHHKRHQRVRTSGRPLGFLFCCHWRGVPRNVLAQQLWQTDEPWMREHASARRALALPVVGTSQLGHGLVSAGTRCYR